MAKILDLLRAQSEPLYALLDAARDDEILTLLYGMAPGAFQSLYDGASEARLGPSGPYLVALSDHDDLLKAILRKGWGQGWGIFATARGDFGQVRKHFRSLMMVKRVSDGSEMYFRFYDPRVIRPFLPTCSPEQVRQMFGPASAYIAEAQGGVAAVRFTPDRIDGELFDLEGNQG